MILERFYATQLSAGDIGKTGCERQFDARRDTLLSHARQQVASGSEEVATFLSTKPVN